jgi:hypothetical protein
MDVLFKPDVAGALQILKVNFISLRHACSSTGMYVAASHQPHAAQARSTHAHTRANDGELVHDMTERPVCLCALLRCHEEGLMQPRHHECKPTCPLPHAAQSTDSLARAQLTDTRAQPADSLTRAHSLLAD